MSALESTLTSRLLAFAALIAIAVLVGASTASARVTLERFENRTSIGDHFPTSEGPPGSFGTAFREAGAHPNLTTALKFGFGFGGEFRDVVVDLPAGMIGNPTIGPKCEVSELTAAAGQQPACPISSQVGVARVEGEPLAPGVVNNAIYNMVPPPNLPALFAFNFQAGGVPIFIEPTVRPGDYGIRTVSLDNLGVYTIHSVALKFWGVPADASHDPERSKESMFTPGGASPLARLPFLSSPTSCEPTPGRFTLDVNQWADPTFVHDEVVADPDGVPFLWEHCNRLRFEPTLDIQPGAKTAASPSGFEATLKVPQDQDPDGLATPHLKRVKVTLPEGISISPAAASGIGGCSEAQIGFGTHSTPTCPGSSSLGTVNVRTPVLDQELEGEVFLAKQKENPFGSLLALYLAIKGPGFYVKLAGKTDMDPVTGQITTTFDRLPQLPFEQMKLNFRGGAKAPLVMPDKCGTYTTQVDITSWASPVPAHLETPATIDQNCNTGGFDPELHAGSTNPVAGANTPFNVQIVRDDTEQNIAGVETTLPKGLVARLAGIPLCEGAAAASGNCPAASEIGKLTAAGGNGPQPLYIPEPGKPGTHVYFGGPYKGAPYSMVFMVPAQAGPFDLGTIVVRGAVYLDPTTAQVTVKSDPLPQILEGIPLKYRDLRIEITKPSFTLNPTNCNPKRFESTITSAQGKVATPSSRFQASDCASLPFAPKLTVALKGGTKRAQYPALRAVLKQAPGQANIAKVATTLPHSEFLANEHIQTICTRVQYAAHNCPEKAIYGKATAWSPLLDQPITGPVYLRSSSHELPDLVADLGGAIDIDLVGRVDSVNESIRTTFETVPDAPVSKFVLEMAGGKKSLLVNSTDICRGTHRAKVLIDGQNGKTADQRPKVKAQCGKARKAKKKSR